MYIETRKLASTLFALPAIILLPWSIADLLGNSAKHYAVSSTYVALGVGLSCLLISLLINNSAAKRTTSGEYYEFQGIELRTLPDSTEPLFFAQDILLALGVTDKVSIRRSLLGLSATKHIIRRKEGDFLTAEGVDILLSKKGGRTTALLEKYTKEIYEYRRKKTQRGTK